MCFSSVSGSHQWRCSFGTSYSKPYKYIDTDIKIKKIEGGNLSSNSQPHQGFLVYIAGRHRLALNRYQKYSFLYCSTNTLLGGFSQSSNFPLANHLFPPFSNNQTGEQLEVNKKGSVMAFAS